MFDILNGDPEWTNSEFVDIHVRHFIGPTGFNLPPHFDVEVASPIDYFQMFFFGWCVSNYLWQYKQISKNSCYTKASNQPRLQGKSLDGNNRWELILGCP